MLTVFKSWKDVCFVFSCQQTTWTIGSAQGSSREMVARSTGRQGNQVSWTPRRDRRPRALRMAWTERRREGRCGALRPANRPSPRLRLWRLTPLFAGDLRADLRGLLTTSHMCKELGVQQESVVLSTFFFFFLWWTEAFKMFFSSSFSCMVRGYLKPHKNDQTFNCMAFKNLNRILLQLVVKLHVLMVFNVFHSTTVSYVIPC